MKKADTNKDFSSSNRFEILQDNVKEKNHDLNKNDPSDNNNSDSNESTVIDS